MNILTFDIEEWYLEKAFFGDKASKYAEYDRILDALLEQLSLRGLRGTFFCLGRMGVDFPEVVRKIDAAGHEVGCHSNAHQWLSKMTYNQAMEDTHSAIDALQQCIGKKIESYRAPAFSIGSFNRWAFEVLAANGISRDASVFPASRDFGGFPEFAQSTPVLLQYNGIELHEYPVSTVKLFGKRFAYSGGGYFRFFPYNFVSAEMRRTPYTMTYFHLGDLNPVVSGVLSPEAYENYFQEKGTFKARYLRYLKTNLGVKGNKTKLFRLISDFLFYSIDYADQMIEWSNQPIVTL